MRGLRIGDDVGVVDVAPWAALALLAVPVGEPGDRVVVAPLLVVVLVLVGLTRTRAWVLAAGALAFAAWRIGAGNASWWPPRVVVAVAVGVAAGLLVATMARRHCEDLDARAQLFAGSRRLGRAGDAGDAAAVVADTLAAHLGASSVALVLPGRPEPAPGPGARALFPLVADGTPVGHVVVTWDDAHGRPARVDEVGLQMFLARAAHEVVRHARTARIGGRSASDPLTGLANRRTVEAGIASLGPGDGIAVLALDEPTPDIVRAFAGELSASCRGADWCGRLDSERFVVVLQGIGIDATPAVHGLRRRWRASGHRATFCAGVAVHTAGASPFETLAAADHALVDARVEGQDRIVRAGRVPQRAEP